MMKNIKNTINPITPYFHACTINIMKIENNDFITIWVL